MVRLVIVFVLLSRRACVRRRGANGIRGSILSAPPLSPAFGVLIFYYCGLLFAHHRNTRALPVLPPCVCGCVGVSNRSRCFSRWNLAETDAKQHVGERR